MHPLQNTIERAYEQRAEITPDSVDEKTKQAIHDAIELLDAGTLRVAEKQAGKWHVNEWLKKAVLLYFRVTPSQVVPGGFTQFYDKVPLKYIDYTEAQFQQQGARIVPHACVRKGAFVGKNTVVMPSYINTGAYVDSGALIDTWATVGSCAQIGKNVHLSGGAGIGGVLEPLQATPTIIEDNCFIGARSEIVEGVIVEENSVISMGVFIGQSTKIYNRITGEISYGRVPAGSVVVAGSLPASDGSHSLYCAVIIKQVDEKTRGKTSINELLRG
ncbi:MAG: 2,3,4,5-tetrahydropyridine-2,6-dicarboxylate N-succinyltransferase [Proteobacteria bacterium]|nr:2,3,4,5-tetrahydropyridine-2,6-dicarboxylate N-succinyltransferase [Pseudomonadota bacterium]